MDVLSLWICLRCCQFVGESVVVVGDCSGKGGWMGMQGEFFWGREGVWVCVCGLKYPGFEVFYFNFLSNY